MELRDLTYLSEFLHLAHSKYSVKREAEQSCDLRDDKWLPNMATY